MLVEEDHESTTTKLINQQEKLITKINRYSHGVLSMILHLWKSYTKSLNQDNKAYNSYVEI